MVLVGCGLSLSEFKDSQLRSAIKAGSIEDVKKAIANGANVNAMAFRSYGALVSAPLDQAASRGHMEIVQLLIAKGADVNAQNDYGETPLDYDAWYNSETEIADLLRNHGGKTRKELEAADK